MNYLKFVFKIIIIFNFMLIIASCDNNAENHLIYKYDLKNYKNSTSIKISDLNIDDIKYVPLQTSDKSVISHIRTIAFVDSFIYLMDYNRIFKFTKEGRFVSQIGKKGNGPGEFKAAFRFSISNSRECLYILDRGVNKIHIYTFAGHFVGSLEYPSFVTNIYCLEDYILCYCANSLSSIDYSFILIDYQGKIVKNFKNKFKYNVGKISRDYYNEIVSYVYNKELHIKEISSDTVFVLNNNSFKPGYILDHGEKKITAQTRQNMDKLNNFMEVGNTYYIERILLETDNFIYSEFTLENKYFYSLIEKNDSKAIISIDEGIKNDFDGGLSFRPHSLIFDNTVLGWIDAFDLKAHVASADFKNSTPEFPEKKKELEQLANNLNENDNPVLMLVKLKK